MTVKEFVGMFANCKTPSSKTIIKNLHKIKGYDKDNLECPIPNGSRYPFDKRYVSKNCDISFVIAEATYGNRYIDASYFGIYDDQFKRHVDELVEDGILEKNTSNNKYGCNEYNFVPSGIEWLSKKREEYGSKICRRLGTVVGASISVLDKIKKLN